MRIKDVDWESWDPEQVATLLFVIKDTEVLLIYKKRGLGAGKINGPGGKLELGETPKQCAIRETREELCITPTHVQAAGQLFFHSEDMPRLHGHVFIASDYMGTPQETAEAKPIWFTKEDVPYDQMWEDDRYWLPAVLSGKGIHGRFIFIQENLIDYEVSIYSL